MRYFRNPGLRFVLVSYLIIGAAGTFAMLRLLHSGCKAETVILLFLAVLLLYFLVFFGVAIRHYKKLERFTLKIERNLNGHRDLQFDDFSEGNFSVLQDDITDMLIAHMRQEEALQAEKALLSQSLADISHQIKTPLAAMTLTAEQLSAAEMPSLERRLLARRMLDYTARISAFVNTLLKISRMDAEVVQFRKDTFSAASLIDLAVDSLIASMDLREVTLERDIPEDCMIEGDKLWLAEALSNIFKNCMEHTPPGGTIRVTVSENAVYTSIVIRDTGTGIAPEDLPHIFERYYKGKESGSNSVGIGLAFTQMVVHSLGGTIKAENQPNAGAMFTIHLIKMNV